MENTDITWLEKPPLNKPYMIVALSGWANAGEVPSSVLWYILSRMDSTLFAELQTDDFYVYLNSNDENKRPLVNIEDGMIQSFSPVTLNFWAHKAKMGGHDLILISGPEPEQRWNKLVDLILEIARGYEVEKIVILGGSFDFIPHTAPVRITGAANYLADKEDLVDHHIELVNYKGPSSIHTLLMVAAARQNIPAVSLWTHTPHYIQVTNFIGCYGLMLKLNELLGLNIDLEEAKKDGDYLSQQIDRAIEKKPELHDYLKKLESEFHKGNKPAETLINQNIIKEIEDLFKDKPA
jgi:proteasome assembly chaperone (PAC2) family protein